MGVMDTKATCFITHSDPIPRNMVSFLDECSIDTNYPDFSYSTTHTKDIEDLNWMDPRSTEETNHPEALATEESLQSQWIFKTGATDHMSGRQVTDAIPGKSTVTVAGSSTLQVTGIGKATFQVAEGLLSITNVLRVTDLRQSSLLSWQRLASKRFTMKGEGTGIQILKVVVVKAIATLDSSRNVYLLGETTKTALHVATKDFSVWHSSLGHLHPSYLPKLRKMVKDPQHLPLTGSKDRLERQRQRLPTVQIDQTPNH